MTDEELIDAMDGLPTGADDGTEDGHWTFQWTEDAGWDVYSPGDEG